MSSPPNHNQRRRVRLLVQGRVQGVGFRPTLYRAITSRECGGTIKNTPMGVEIDVEGNRSDVNEIVDEFAHLIPKRARVDHLDVEDRTPEGRREFTIQHSSSRGNSLLPIPPDLATCEGCERELLDDSCRRFAYPFNTCTCCGPRFTIARAVPFDRPMSAMDNFPLCESCRKEYGDPTDRRFHAQTMSCPDCGPSLHFSGISDDETAEQPPLARARDILRRGQILAIKGLGGFHLACDATNPDAVAELRKRKNRPHKPFAIMAADWDRCQRIAVVGRTERNILKSPESPIVLLQRQRNSVVTTCVAPGLQRIGVMLPYTPLHKLLFQSDGMPDALVMTSCNRSGEPIATSVETIRDALSDIPDAILWHDRPIENRCDDSLVAIFDEHPLPMRRSRGYVPEPVMLPTGGPSVFATGAMWKNTFVVTKGRRAFASQHIGNVSNADNAHHFAATFRKFSDLLGVEPGTVVCDQHPDYPTTQFARQLANDRHLSLIQVQHHHAHLASCLAEHQENGPAIGVSMDGTGYGDDSHMWGGEFFIFNRQTYTREFHFEYLPMPGGDQAVIEPRRMALSHLVNAFGPSRARRQMQHLMRDDEIDLLLNILHDRDISPLTSSCGRLFDAVSALLGFQSDTTYQGQAACELEARCAPDVHDFYDFSIEDHQIALAPLIRNIWEDILRDTSPSVIASKFHNTLAELILETCRQIREESDLCQVALSGGVMQNIHLLNRLVPALEEQGFDVLIHRIVPPNDGGIALGQASIALARLSDHDMGEDMG